MTNLITRLFVEQPLAFPRSAKKLYSVFFINRLDPPLPCRFGHFQGTFFLASFQAGKSPSKVPLLSLKISNLKLKKGTSISASKTVDSVLTPKS